MKTYNINSKGIADHLNCQYVLADDALAVEKELGSVRELLAEAYILLSGKTVHASDCATSCSPAETPGHCDCSA